MEPNILATPNDSLATNGTSWSGISEPVVHAPLDGSRRTPEFPANGTTLVAVAAAPTLAPAAPHAPASPHVPTHTHGIKNGASRSRWMAAAVTLAAPTVNVAEAAAAAVTEPEGIYLRHGKRVLDVVGALIGLVFGLPLMGLAALIIKLESRGPVLYRSQRIGRGGQAFTFFKLRSMMDGADRHRHRLSHLNEADGPVFKMSRDPRVTRVGRFLRMSSLDELPQLFNVLRGEMSLVGPRPPIPEEVSQYEPWQFRRLAVKPGLTCLWQISGRSRLGFQEWMRLDLEYIRHQSLALDVKILVRTVPAVLSREGAY